LSRRLRGRASDQKNQNKQKQHLAVHFLFLLSNRYGHVFFNGVFRG
jgi:hypothetical protein